MVISYYPLGVQPYYSISLFNSKLPSCIAAKQSDCFAKYAHIVCILVQKVHFPKDKKMYNIIKIDFKKEFERS